MRTIVTLKYGNKYSSNDVNTIYNMCKYQCDEFWCRTDNTDGLEPVSYTHLRAHETPEHRGWRVKD